MWSPAVLSLPSPSTGDTQHDHGVNYSLQLSRYVMDIKKSNPKRQITYFDKILIANYFFFPTIVI